jgi:hypothetical protein
VVALEHMRQKLVQAETPDYSLFRSSLLTPLRERSIAAEKRIYEATIVVVVYQVDRTRKLNAEP